MRLLVSVLLLPLAACGGGIDRSPYEPNPGSSTLPVALLSQPAGGDPATNRAFLLEEIDRVVANHPTVRLIAVGEAALGWYWKGLDNAYQRSIAEPLDGPTALAMMERARRHHVFLSYGFAELDGALVYNSAVVIDDTGAIVAHHRKSNLVTMDELSGFTRAERQLTRFTIDGLEAALLICNDFNDDVLTAELQKDEKVRLVLLPQSSAGLRPEVANASPYRFEGKWMLAPQRVGTEGLDRYHGAWAVAPNGWVTAGTPDVPGSLFLELAVPAPAAGTPR